MPDAIDASELCVTARYEQRDERKLRPLRRQERRQQVALQMVDAEHRDAERFAERVRVGRAHEQRAREPGAFRVADAA